MIGEDLSDGVEETSSARSRDGAISVITTPAGLPLAVRIDDTQLRKHPQAVAADVLRLCQQSAMASAIRLRARLLDAGTPTEVVESLGLPRPDDLAGAELRDDDEADAPASWLRSV
ncbi:hypothetical protein EF294_10935 [Gordonia oryzae]|uniref:YbaB/EbfC family DNA-binding protein n=1 Tax=Gordonia oryzae TaxID=2487349 RepID=A0A3N4GPX8_9ACTN|nr:hypothetical protein [Gordonia oryzae]RPA61141.1 hypothetical protein EF294_10935 [Gordonia oryzae]